MLNIEVFINGMKDLVYFYPSWNVATEEKEAMKRWYEMFKHIDDDTFNNMVAEHIKVVEFNPTVASLFRINKLVRPKETRLGVPEYNGTLGKRCEEDWI